MTLTSRPEAATQTRARVSLVTHPNVFPSQMPFLPQLPISGLGDWLRVCWLEARLLIIAEVRLKLTARILDSESTMSGGN